MYALNLDEGFEKRLQSINISQLFLETNHLKWAVSIYLGLIVRPKSPTVHLSETKNPLTSEISVI